MAQSAVMVRFLARIRPELAATFSAEQIAAVELHFGMRYLVKHAIDWRARFGLPFAKVYFVVLAGRERRSPEL